MSKSGFSIERRDTTGERRAHCRTGGAEYVDAEVYGAARLARMRVTAERAGVVDHTIRFAVGS